MYCNDYLAVNPIEQPVKENNGKSQND